MTAKPTPIDMGTKTLQQVLDLLNWTHQPCTKTGARHVFDDQGRDQGLLRYEECTALLRKKGLIK